MKQFMENRASLVLARDPGVLSFSMVFHCIPSVFVGFKSLMFLTDVLTTVFRPQDFLSFYLVVLIFSQVVLWFSLDFAVCCS